MTDTENLPERVEARKIVDKFSGSLAGLLPTHLRDDGGQQWIASVKAVLATKPEIRIAAENDPNALMAALIQAATKGLVPGTKEFHLVPFAPRRDAPRVIQGIEGYQGIIERIYRAGAVSSVIVEVVKKNDKFSYAPGRDERPQHEVDWFGPRGDLIGAYAYALMVDGATSKVVIVGPDEIERAKAKSASAGSKYSPWNTDPDAMWMKTAARRLENWVPTSSEYRRQKLRDAQAVLAEQSHAAGLADAIQIPESMMKLAEQADDDDLDGIDPETGEVLDVVDAEVVEDRGEERAGTPTGAGEGPAGVAATVVGAGGGPAPTTSPEDLPAGEGGGAATPAPPAEAGEAARLPASPARLTSRQRQALRTEASRLDIQASTAVKLTYFATLLGLPEGKQLTAVDDLTFDQGEELITILRSLTSRAELDERAAGQDTL